MDKASPEPGQADARVTTTIRLRDGDVRALAVIMTDEGATISVFDEGDDGRPLIQAVLTSSEYAALLRALLAPGGAAGASGGPSRPGSGVPAGSCRTRGRA